MRFTCLASDMVNGLNIVTRAIATRSTIQILEGVLLTTCPEGLRLTCTDLALGIETHIDAEIAEEGSVVLPGKLLAEIMRKLPEERMELRVNDQMWRPSAAPARAQRCPGWTRRSIPRCPRWGTPSPSRCPHPCSRT